MIKLTTAAAALVLATLAAVPASAQRYTHYPVCAVYGGWRGGTESCAFMNFQQCYMSVSGRGGYCTANPFYQPPRGKRSSHRYRY